MYQIVVTIESFEILQNIHELQAQFNVFEDTPKP